MIISPPFLPPHRDDETDEDFVARAMTGSSPGRGAFPVSLDLGWHGGLHIEAPAGTNGRLPVRAVADGTVVFRRDATAKPSAPAADDPLNYGDGWTSDGVVVIRHDTETGEGANAKVRFFSIYMHLNQIGAAVKKDSPIYRKDEIGQAGYIYGAANLIHFEIVCDDDNVAKLVGRRTGKLPITQDGRIDAVFGQMYFAVPTGTAVHSEDMRAAQRSASEATSRRAIAERRATRAEAAAAAAPGNSRLASAARTARADVEKLDTAVTDYTTLKAAAPSFTTTEPLFVGIEHERGNVRITTWREDGTIVGSAIDEADREYVLYDDASHLYPASPSAGYDLLRFGRVLGPDTLNPADTSHWRQISYVGGQGWCDLRPDTIRKFSDADFPHWREWALIDDDTDGDSRADSEQLAKLILKDGETVRDRSELSARLAAAPGIRAALSRTICKIPSEWDDRLFDERYAWLKDPAKIIGTQLSAPMTEENFGRLKAHVTKLHFWADAGFSADAAWHFEPSTFITTFRRCGWMSAREMVGLLPSGHGILGAQTMRTRLTAGINTARQILPPLMYQAINKTLNRYVILGPLRVAHFFGQIVQETDRLQTVREYASGADYEGRADLGNTQPGDGVRFRGRGVVQLTGRGHYHDYGTYRNQDFETEPHQLILQNEAYAACDASGFYWVAEETRDRQPRPSGGYRWVLDGLININRRSDLRTFQTLQDDAQINAQVLNVTRQVNRAALGLDNRQVFFKAAYFAMSDEVLPSPGITNLKA